MDEVAGVAVTVAGRAGSVRGSRRRRALWVAVLLVVPLLVALTGKDRPASADGTDCTVSPILVNSCRPWFGGTAANYPQAASDSTSQLLYAEQRYGRPLEIVHTYHDVGNNALTPTDTYFATRPGTMLFTNWKPGAKWADFADQNPGIDSMAASIKAISPARIFVTLNHEPENDVSPGGDPDCPGVTFKGTFGSVADYRAMWRHVRERFAADGVNNVVWVMDYMNWPPWDCLVRGLWPGNDLVDWVTFNGYQEGGAATFSSMVGHFYNQLLADNDASHDFASKPWGVLEWSGTGFTPQQETNYIVSGKTALDANTFPRLKAYMYFDERDHGVNAGKNFRVAYDDDGTPDPTKASKYYAFAADARFSGTYQAPPPPLDNSVLGVTLDQPSDGATLTGALPVSGTLSNAAATAQVALYVDGTEVTSAVPDASGTYSLDWDSSTVADGAHSLQVHAVNAAGLGFVSDAIAVTTSNGVVGPGTPTGLTATATGPTSVGLTWTPPLDGSTVSGYRVFRDGAPIQDVAADATSFSDITALAKTSYSYEVSGLSANGLVSPRSAPVGVTTPSATGDRTAPTTPGNVKVALNANKQPALSWSASTDNVKVTTYAVYRDGVQLARTPSLTFADTTAVSGATYRYSVAALDAAGNASAPSTPVAFTFDTTPPSVPTALAGTAASRSVSLTWAPSTDNVAVKGYYVNRNGVRVATVTSGVTWTDSGLTTGTRYSYYVVAFDAAANKSAGSKSISIAAK